MNCCRPQNEEQPILNLNNKPTNTQNWGEILDWGGKAIAFAGVAMGYVGWVEGKYGASAMNNNTVIGGFNLADWLVVPGLTLAGSGTLLSIVGRLMVDYGGHKQAKPDERVRSDSGNASDVVFHEERGLGNYQPRQFEAH